MTNTWHEAKTFRDLTELTCRAIKFGRATPVSYASDNEILAVDSLPYKTDYLMMNNLGFLTFDSQPGSRTVDVEKNEPFANMASGVSLKNADPAVKGYISEQREYVEGLITQEKLAHLARNLTDVMIKVKRFNGCTDEIIAMASRYEFKSPDYGSYLIMDKAVNVNKYINLSYQQNKTDTHHYTNCWIDGTSSYYSLLEPVLDPRLFHWLIKNTYEITIMATKYNTNHINKQILSLLSR